MPHNPDLLPLVATPAKFMPLSVESPETSSCPSSIDVEQRRDSGLEGSGSLD